MSRPIHAIFPGLVADGSFMQAGHDGARDAAAKASLSFRVTQGVTLPGLQAAIAMAAEDSAGLVLAQGGQCEAAMAAVAPRFPTTRFAVVQGHAAGPNLYAYRAAQEQSAFLAGAAAGLLARGPVVGHVSGIRPRPGLLARAAFAAGLAYTAPGRRLLSIFTGDQDDSERGAAAAERLAEAGADIVFTMLNAAQAAVMEVARRRGLRLVGDGQDWVARRPDIFLLAAVADSGAAAAAAIADYAAGRRVSGQEVVFGLEAPEVVRLVVAHEAALLALQIDAIGAAVAAGQIAVPDTMPVEEMEGR
jgi:basic membrane protein A